MAFNLESADELVHQLWRTDWIVFQKIGLLSSSNVNSYVQGEPLIVHYLRKELNFRVLAAFTSYGCDLNVQGRDGLTPLHVVAARKLLSNQVEAIGLLIGHGADPFMVDNDGNNALMVAVLMGQDQIVTEFVTKYKTISQSLVTQKNSYGHDALALFFLSCYRYCYGPDDCLEQLLELGCGVTSTDKMGDNCLHHLARCPDKDYHSALYYDAISGQKSSPGAFGYRNHSFKSHLKMLIGAGADNSEQNKSGLIPLQVALSSELNKYRAIFDLETLVPDENVLELLLPRPDNQTMIGEPLNISVQVWLVAQVVKFGFKLSKDTLTIVRASTFITPSLLEHVISKCTVKPTAEDLKVPFVNRDWNEVGLYIKHMLRKAIGDLKLVIPDIVGQIILYGENYRLSKDHMVEILVSSGLPITVNDLKLALDTKQLNIAQHLILNMDSSFEYKISCEIPDVLVQILLITLRKYSYTFEKVQPVVKKLVNDFNINVTYVNSSKDSAIQCIMDMVCKRLQSETEAMKLFYLVVNLKEFDRTDC